MYYKEGKGQEPLFLALDAAWGLGSFWVTCIVGGLVEVRPGSPSTAVARHPGNDRTFTTVQFHPDSIGAGPLDPARKPVFVDVDTVDSAVWVACEEGLWSLTRPDTSGGPDWVWNRIADTSIGVESYLGLSVRSRRDTTIAGAVFVTVAKESGDTVLYRYAPADSQWTALSLVRRGDFARQVEAGRDDYLFVVHGGMIGLYRDRGDKIDFVVDLMDRVRDEDSPSFDPAQVLLTGSGGVVRMWVASPLGLYFCSDSLYDPSVTMPFTLVRKSAQIKGGLEETYAYPSIIDVAAPWGRAAEAVFAYNLDKDDKVTIDVFDWNMDHVIRIIDAQPRRAGSSRADGRSTVLKSDRWDGTFDNRGGRPVAPGVYYYRISTEKGKRAFGKVIVARN